MGVTSPSVVVQPDQRAPSAIRDDARRLHAKSVDPKSYQLARSKVDRRFLAQTYSRRSSGGGDVAGLKGHKLAQVADQEC